MSQQDEIEEIVRKRLDHFANRFESRHVSEADDPEGTINRKIHNVFLAELNEEVLYYAALVRSFDSTFGNMIEKLAIDIAELNYEVSQEVQGPLAKTQTEYIATLLEQYKRRERPLAVDDYQELRTMYTGEDDEFKRHASDYYLVDEETNEHFLVELKIGGDLDNKKARSEKEALLEQYTILSNSIGIEVPINIRFGTAYNKFGEGEPWEQGRVRQYFADEELLIGRDFWNFICKSDTGYEQVLSAYHEHTDLVMDSLASIKETYLG